MSSIQAFHIEKLRADFENIITMKHEIAKIKVLVSDKLTQLKNVYNELVKTNPKKIFLFCLDSFYFQYKSFALELENIDKTRALSNNRMYCDYYKLYNIILKHIKENDEMILSELDYKTYPVYKDLDPFLEYRVEDIRDIHASILGLIKFLYDNCTSKSEGIEQYNEQHSIGYSISNYLNTLGFENTLLHEQISLYINYVSFFHISQKKQLHRIFLRMQDFHKEVDDNITVNRAFSIDDIQEDQHNMRFFIIGEDVPVDCLLEDAEYSKVLENEDKKVPLEPVAVGSGSDSPTGGSVPTIQQVSINTTVNVEAETSKPAAVSSRPSITEATITETIVIPPST